MADDWETVPKKGKKDKTKTAAPTNVTSTSAGPKASGRQQSTGRTWGSTAAPSAVQQPSAWVKPQVAGSAPITSPWKRPIVPVSSTSLAATPSTTTDQPEQTVSDPAVASVVGETHSLSSSAVGGNAVTNLDVKENTQPWDVIRQMKNLDLSHQNRHGRAGVPVRLLTNRVSIMTIPKQIVVYHFKFKEGEEGKYAMKSVDLTKFIDIANEPLAYDGSKILIQYGVTSKGLATGIDRSKVHEDTYVDDILVKLFEKHKNLIELDTKALKTLQSNVALDARGNGNDIPSEIMQYLNIVFTKNLPTVSFEELGSAGSDRGGGRGGRGGGASGGARNRGEDDTLQLRYRFKTALTKAEVGPQFALDVQANVVFKEMPVLDFLQKKGLYNSRSGQLGDISRALKELDGLKVKAMHRSETQVYTIRAFSDKACGSQYTDPIKDKGYNGRTITVYQYFQEQYPEYAKKLNPNIPCARTSTKANIFYPLEVLMIVTEQTFKGEIPRSAVSKVHLTPQERIGLIKSGTRETVNALMRSSAQMMSVAGAMTQVPGRKLAANNVAGRGKFYKATTLSSWVVISTDRNLRPELITNGVNEFIKNGTKYGMQIAKPAEILQIGTRELKAALNQRQRVQLFLVICAESDKDSYVVAKNFSWIDKGIPVQCSLSKHFMKEKGIGSYMANLLLKVNLKLGGGNFKYSTHINGMPGSGRGGRTLVLGMDVSHGMLNVMSGSDLPSHGSAALVSLDPATMQFRSSFTSQAGRGDVLKPETLTTLLSALKLDLSQYSSVLFYRDGIGSGLFPDVEKNEISTLKNYFAGKKLTFVVLIKNHRTRFFKMLDPSGNMVDNPDCGTVVDSVITEKEDFDFYLQAQNCGIGTARIPHYITMHDENKFTADSLQNVTHELSNMYQRSFGPVSQVTPTFYAHLLADKCRMFMTTQGEFPPLHANVVSTSPLYFL